MESAREKKTIFVISLSVCAWKVECHLHIEERSESSTPPCYPTLSCSAFSIHPPGSPTDPTEFNWNLNIAFETFQDEYLTAMSAAMSDT